MMLSEEPRSPISEHRKVTKSAMEKKRRARINSSLTELKTILAGIMAYKDERFEKMEKADILEMTVNYVKELQNKSSAKDNHVHQDDDNYRTGVNSCISEVIRYVTASNDCDTDTKTKLLDHLANRVNDISTTARAAFVHSPVQSQNSNLNVVQDVRVQQADVNNNVNDIHGTNKTSCLNVNTQNVTLDTTVTHAALGSPLAAMRFCAQSPSSTMDLQKQFPVSQTQPSLIPVSMSGQPQVLTNVSQIQPQLLQNVPLTILVPANFCTSSNGTTCVIPLTLSSTGSESGIAINPGNITENTVKGATQGIAHSIVHNSNIVFNPNGLTCVNNGSVIQDVPRSTYNSNDGQTTTENQNRTIENYINLPKESKLDKCQILQSGNEFERSKVLSENSLSTTYSHQVTLSRKSPSPLNKDRSVWRPWRL